MRTPFAPYRCLATAALLASTLLVPAEAQHRAVDGRVAKPAHTPVRSWHEADLIGVKLVDGLPIRVRSGGLDDGRSGALAPAGTVLAGVAAGTWERTHRLDEARLSELVARARARGATVPDLGLDLRLRLAPGLSASIAIDALNALDIVELAWPVAKPLPPPSAPDFTMLQTYSGLAPQGLGVRAAWPRPAATGRRVRVCDVEYEFDPTHVDLPSVWQVNPWVGGSFADHGTAVLGQLFGKSDGKGTTGLVPLADPSISPPITPGHGYNVAAAITDALSLPPGLDRGDVILIEQQTAGPNYNPPPCCFVGGCPPGTDCQFGLVPSEWDPSVHNAIALAVGLGVHVVEAAGNGSQNLDDPIYGGWFGTLNDSGAILVGAGAAPGGSTVDRSRLSFSNYGSTVDLQGQGELVATTGYGDLYGGPGSPEAYTSVFSGTSSASPMVAAACALVSSTFEEQTQWPMAPREMRELLRLTGSAQTSGINPASQNIGPRPNVVAALTELEMWRIGDDDPWSYAPQSNFWVPFRDAAYAYDSSRGRTVVVAAEDPFGNPWSIWPNHLCFSGNFDSICVPPAVGPSPSPRIDAAAAYDAKRDRIVLFGGVVFGSPNGETWEFDPEMVTWTLASTTGPAPRSEHSLVYDPVRERVVLVGGNCGGSCGALTWEWNGSTWAAFAGPPERTHAALAWDSDRSRIVLFGGRSPTTLLDLGDTWERNGTAWTLVSSGGPSARSSAGAAYDTSRRRFVLDGGYSQALGSNTNDLWEWDGLSWRQPTGMPFPGFPGSWLSGHALVYDTANGAMIGFGGQGAPYAGPVVVTRYRRYELGAPYCFGDGTGGSCPCGNVTDRFVKEGCVNSQGTGAKLRSNGMASLFHPQPQRPVLQGSGMPNGPALYFQGTAKVNGGLGTVFGDGRLCVSGTTIRLGIKFNLGGASQFPELTDPDLGSPWLIPDTGTRFYQIWYRDSTSFCTGSGFNLSNALRVVWGL